MESKSSQTDILKEKQKIIDLQDQIIAQNRDKITDLREQNEKKEQQIIQLEKSIKEKQDIIDKQAEIVSNIKEFLHNSDATIGQLNFEIQEKQNQIAELKETNSKLVNPRMVLTVNALKEKSFYWEPKMFEKQTLITRSLDYKWNEWFADDVEVFFDGEDFKIYVQESLYIKSLPVDQFPMLIEHLCPNSFDWLDLTNLTISFVDYKNLVAIGNIAILDIHQVIVKNEDGSLIGVDQLLKEVPNVMHFNYTFNDGEKMEGLAEKFAQLPLLPKFSCLDLLNIQEGFDLKIFGQFIQKYTENRFWTLGFKVTKETFAEMERIKKEIVSTLPSSFGLKIFNEEIIKNRRKKTQIQRSENKISELQTTNSKLLDLHDVLTVHEYQRPKVNRGIKFQNRTLLTFRMDYINKKWLADGNIKVYFDDANFKIFIQDSLVLNALPTSKFRPLIERLHSNSFSQLFLTNLAISFVDYKNLVGKSNIRKLGIHRVTVQNENGTHISVDQLLKEVPNIHFFNYTFNYGESVNGIAQKLVELPKFQELYRFQLLNIPEGFDSEVFGQFVKKNEIKEKDLVLRFENEMLSKLTGVFLDNSQSFF